MENQEKQCCPKFSPEKWDGKTHEWTNKPFIKEDMPTFFHIPLPFLINKKVTRLCKEMEDSQKAETDSTNVLLLFRDPTAFKSEIYLSVLGPVSGADNVTISGTFISKVFSGSYSDVPNFMKQMKEYLKAQNKTAKDYYIHYAYCPKCAKKYGDNYMIIFAKV